MKVNKLKILFIAIFCCAVTALWSDVLCMEPLEERTLYRIKSQWRSKPQTVCTPVDKCTENNCAGYLTAGHLRDTNGRISHVSESGVTSDVVIEHTSEGKHICKDGNDIWYFEEVNPNTNKINLNILENRLINIEKLIAQQSARYQLASSSFLSGASYSLFPEIVRDILNSRGYSRTANLAATLVQGGLIVYNTASYVPTITGLSVRTGFSHLGFSDQTSTTIGSSAAVLSSIVTGLVFSQETALDCVVNCAIAVGGSYAGGTVALKAKSWVYGLWNNSGGTSKEKLISTILEREREIKELKEERKELYSLTSKTDQK